MSILEAESEWKDVWKIYDLDKDGIISKEDFESAIRVLGRRFTVAQMEEKLKKVPARIDFDFFLEFLHEPYDGPTKEQLEIALRAFDGRDIGVLAKGDIQSMMMGMGDKLNDAELEVVMKHIPTNSSGQVPIDSFIEYLNPPVPSTKPNIPQLMKELLTEELAKRSDKEQRLVKAKKVSANSDDDDEDEGDVPPPPPAAESPPAAPPAEATPEAAE